MTATDLSRAAWPKSTYSGNGGDCVEVAPVTRHLVAVRDSKDPDGPKLAFAPHVWRSFAAQVKTGA